MGILNQLGIDISAIYQFFAFFVIFMVLKNLVFNKLQTVLEIREQKTSKTEKGANEKLNQALSMEKEFTEQMDQTYHEAQKLMNTKKEEIQKTAEAKIHQGEKTLSQDYERSRAEMEEAILGKKEGVMANANQLSNDLVQKLIQ